jgi:hypothetical protein
MVTPNPIRNRHFRDRIGVAVKWLCSFVVVVVLLLLAIPLVCLWFAWHGVKRPLHALGLLLDDLSRE